MKQTTFISHKEERINKYKSLKTSEEKEQYFNEIVLEYENVEIEKLLLTEQINLEKSRKYGRKTEQSNIGQLSIYDINPELNDSNMDVFNEAEEINATQTEETEVITYTRRKRNNKNNENNNNIEVIIHHHKLDDNKCTCPKCGGVYKEIGTTETKVYEFIPAKIVLNNHIEHTYKCSTCSTDIKDEIFKVKRNTSFPKLMVEDSFVSHIIVEKYLKHVPLYRQEKVMKNYGLEVSRMNFSNWIIKAATILKPLVDLMYQNILKSDICHMDETTLRVLEENNEKSYIWGLCSSKYDKPAYIYFFEPNRKHQNAKDILKGFNGYVCTDGYEAYRRISNITNVGCLAHARRKYVELLKTITEESSFYEIASTGKKYIDKLYKIEHQIENLSIQEKYDKRQELSKPILEEYFEWCKNNPYKEHKQFILTKAINYSLNGKDELQNYLLDGRLEIDNNRAERMMKSFVIGRKNFLFCVSDCGAESSSLLFSIIESAYANNIRVEQYLTYVFKTLPTINQDEIEELSKLLPYSNDLPENIKTK